MKIMTYEDILTHKVISYWIHPIVYISHSSFTNTFSYMSTIKEWERKHNWGPMFTPLLRQGLRTGLKVKIIIQKQQQSPLTILQTTFYTFSLSIHNSYKCHYLFSTDRKLRDSKRVDNYSNPPDGFTARHQHLLSLGPWAKLSFFPRYSVASHGPTVYHIRANHRQNWDVGRMTSVPPISPKPALFPPFNVPISPRFLGVSTCPGSPRHAGKCYCPPQDNSPRKVGQIWPRHDTGCRWTSMNRKLALAKNPQWSPGKQQGCYYPAVGRG